MSNKNIIITGANGQLGSFFVEFLLRNTDYHIIATVKDLKTTNLNNISDFLNNLKLELRQIKLDDEKSIKSLIEEAKPDYFINCAGISDISSSFEYPEKHIICNTLGVLYQLKAIKQYSSHAKYFNCGSSYELENIQNIPQNEKSNISNANFYSISKGSSRNLIKIYRELYNLFAIQGWLFNFESEKRGEKFITRKITKNISEIYYQIKSGQSIVPISLGNINSRRDWQYCGDVVEGIWLMLNNNKPKEYILSSGHTHSIKEFIELAFYYINIKGEWINNDPDKNPINEIFYNETYGTLVNIDKQFYRPIETNILWGDPSLIKKELNWQPKVSFTQLVQKMVENDIKKL